jgi:hypothetical protein
VKLKKPTIFLQRSCKNIWTNSFGICVGNLWQVNTNVQFIFDTYATTSYCRSYLIKIDKTITKELKTIIINCNENKIEVNICIKKNEEHIFQCLTNVNTIGYIHSIVYSTMPCIYNI